MTINSKVGLRFLTSFNFNLRVYYDFINMGFYKLGKLPLQDRHIFIQKSLLNPLIASTVHPLPLHRDILTRHFSIFHNDQFIADHNIKLST